MTALLPPRTIECPTATGAVYHHGAQVVDWTPAGAEPVLWMSEHSRLDTTVAIRGGIPICWPWFGAGLRGVASPLHGFARLSEWRMVRNVADDDAVTVTYLLVDAHQDKFDYPYRLTYEVSFGRKFSAVLTVRNTGIHRFTFEEALHTYLRVGDIRKISVVGLDGASYLDKASGHEIGPHQQVGDLTFVEETDRIYQTTADIDVVDPSMGRRITVYRTDSRDAVVWNPWVDKARAMSDFGDDEWQTMLCVETGNVGQHAITLAPGKEHSMGFTLRLSELS